MKALVIGRFQPVHKAHVGVLQEINEINTIDKIILGIGINGEERTERNPFHYDEIKKMWLPETEKLTAEVEIYQIIDIHNPLKYAGHVEEITGCSHEDTIIFSNNDYTIDCFTNYGMHYAVWRPTKIFPMGNNTYLSATMVREWMRNDGSWQDYVTGAVRAVIEEIDGVEIVKKAGNNKMYAK